MAMQLFAGQDVPSALMSMNMQGECKVLRHACKEDKMGKEPMRTETAGKLDLRKGHLSISIQKA